jgi:hypothetical protein
MVWKIKAELESNYCAHCRRAIGRKGTFLIEDETGRTLQVGRTCLKSFLTKKPRRVKVIQSLASLMADEKHTQEMIDNPQRTLAQVYRHYLRMYFGPVRFYFEGIRKLQNLMEGK